MPSPDQLQAMSMEKISTHKLTHILHNSEAMGDVCMKFSDGSVSPEAGNYKRTPNAEVAIPDYSQIG